MTWVELIGAVGAGKSALLPSVIESVQDSNHDACPVVDPGTTHGQTMRGRRRLAAGIAFGLAHPGLAGITTRALLAAPLPWWHRRAIGKLVFRLAATTQGERHHSTHRCLVVDEGWVHRAVNLYGWTPDLELGAVDAYLEHIPHPDLLVVIDAEGKARAGRLAKRGLPKRLRGKDPAVVEGFLRRSERIVEHVAATLEPQGVRVVRIANSTSLQAATASVRAQVPAALGALPRATSTTPMVTIRPPFPISRPSRAGLRALSRSRHAPGLDAPAIADALAEYGLGDQPTTLVDQSGRSLSLLVQTPSGAAVLKRYKASLSASSIHSQHSVLLELERRGFPCPRLRRTLDGSTLVERAGQRYDLTAFLHGYARWDRSLLPPRESLELRQGAGAALAAFHDVLEGFEPPFEHEARVATTQGAGPDPLVAAIDSCLAVDIPAGAPAGSRLLWDRGPQSSASLTTLREQLMRADLPLTVIHGDYGPYNLLVRNERRLAVMDLELSRRDWRLIDLARAIPRFGSNRRGFSLRRARRFLVGYLRLQPLARRELELLPALSAYLDLRRSVVSWERFADSGDVAWLSAAVGHLRNSDRAQDGNHALALISQMIDVEER